MRTDVKHAVASGRTEPGPALGSGLAWPLLVIRPVRANEEREPWHTGVKKPAPLQNCNDTGFRGLVWVRQVR